MAKKNRNNQSQRLNSNQGTDMQAQPGFDPIEEEVTEGTQAEGEVQQEEIIGETDVSQAPAEPEQTNVQEEQPEETVEEEQPPVQAPVVQETTSAPVVEEVKPPVVEDVAPKATVQEEIKEAISANHVDQATSALIHALDTYMTKMAPGVPMDDKTGAANQWGLWKTIHNVIERSTSEESFKKCWFILLKYFAIEGKTAFSDRYVFRFAPHWTQSTDDLDLFQRILNLLILTANHETRSEKVKEVSLERTFEKGLSEEGRNRLIGFYTR